MTRDDHAGVGAVATQLAGAEFQATLVRSASRPDFANYG